MTIDEILEYTRSVVTNEDGEAFEGDSAPKHRECERKFLVDRSKVEHSLPQPWMLVQGYWPGDTEDVSLRIIASRGRAYLRKKSISYSGCRVKQSQRVNLKKAIRRIFDAPLVAYKYRYLLRDEEGLAWLLDYFPEEGFMMCEHEFEDPEEMAEMHMTPVWAGKEVTDSPEGYTRYHAKKLTPDRIRELLKESAEKGSTAQYEPAEDEERGETFQWGHKES